MLAIAFACDPEYGSEAAGGWGTVQALAEFADVSVMLNTSHMANVSAWMERYPNDNPTFVPVPPVHWGLRLNAAPLRLVRRATWLARYVGWQRRAFEMASALHRDKPFDVVIHASLGIYWMPSVAVDLPMPSIWGPVSGGAPAPRRLRRFQGVAGTLGEFAEAAIVGLLSLQPMTRHTWEHADLRLVETESTRQRLPARLRSDTRIVNRAILTRIRPLPDIPRQRYLAFTSPLQSRKGPRLALSALRHTPPDVRLLFINSGPEERALRRLADKLAVADRVEFRGRVPRDEMWDTLAGAAACVFTGLREEGGCALAEAMLAGTPVIVLGHGGARLLAESNTDPSRVAIIEPRDAQGTARRMGEAMARFSAAPSADRRPYLDQRPTKRALRAAVEATSSLSSVDLRRASTSSAAG